MAATEEEKPLFEDKNDTGPEDIYKKRATDPVRETVRASWNILGMVFVGLILVVGLAVGLYFAAWGIAHANDTKSPTLPTVNPTRQPTGQETAKPTKKPTNFPVLGPTENPTKKPTHDPTHNPTHNPTQNPTPPTNKPTQKPATSSPTKFPTTGKPTLSPTESPTGGCYACPYIAGTTALSGLFFNQAPVGMGLDITLYGTPNPIPDCPSWVIINPEPGTYVFEMASSCTAWDQLSIITQYEIMQYLHNFYSLYSVGWVTLPLGLLVPNAPQTFGIIMSQNLTSVGFGPGQVYPGISSQIQIRNAHRENLLIVSPNQTDYLDFFSIEAPVGVCGCNFHDTQDSGPIFGTLLPTVSYLDLYLACDQSTSSSQIGTSLCLQLGPENCQAWGIISSNQHTHRAFYALKAPVVTNIISTTFLETPPTQNPTSSPTTTTESPTTSTPTALPTMYPTLNPTKYPTAPPFHYLTGVTAVTGVFCSNPTLYPTRSPTTPTLAPTKFPTKKPTKPTNNPTPFPTYAPTPPSKSPTKNPTQQPTENPTTHAPTKNPTTRSPTTQKPTTQSPTTSSPTTASPTNNNPTTSKPTTSPTAPTPPTILPTKNPTQNPTLPAANLYLFSDQLLYTAAPGPSFIGDKPTADGRCQAYGDNTLGLGCDAYTSFISFGASQQIANFPTIYGFSPQTSQIYNALNPAQRLCFYGSYWFYCIPLGTSQVLLDLSLSDMGILPPESNFWSATAELVDGDGGHWARTQSCTSSPTTSPTATSYTTTTGNSQVGNSSINRDSPVNAKWLGGQLLPCSTGQAYILCACILFQ